jgi:hypothetical protein
MCYHNFDLLEMESEVSFSKNALCPDTAMSLKYESGLRIRVWLYAYNKSYFKVRTPCDLIQFLKKERIIIL